MQEPEGSAEMTCFQSCWLIFNGTQAAAEVIHQGYRSLRGNEHRHELVRRVNPATFYPVTKASSLPCPSTAEACTRHKTRHIDRSPRPRQVVFVAWGLYSFVCLLHSGSTSGPLCLLSPSALQSARLRSVPRGRSGRCYVNSHDERWAFSNSTTVETARKGEDGKMARADERERGRTWQENEAQRECLVATAADV
ncbi:hypothetical protein KUCAC02_020219, partial [Chaenocephalus aceratus]